MLLSLCESFLSGRRRVIQAHASHRFSGEPWVILLGRGVYRPESGCCVCSALLGCHCFSVLRADRAGQCMNTCKKQTHAVCPSSPGDPGVIREPGSARELEVWLSLVGGFLCLHTSFYKGSWAGFLPSEWPYDSLVMKRDLLGPVCAIPSVWPHLGDQLVWGFVEVMLPVQRWGEHWQELGGVPALLRLLPGVFGAPSPVAWP